MLLELDNVNKSYSLDDKQIHAVQELSLQLHPGQFASVCGPSGCGKSTLLLICGALLRPDSGKVLMSGQDLYSLSPEKRARTRATNVGFVFQQFHLVPYLNVLDNVLAASLGLRSGIGDDRRHIQTRAVELVGRFGLSDRVRHLPAELSTGERQRVALARSLLNRPKILLADEPTGNLDAKNSEVVLEYLQEFVSTDGAVLLVTHDHVAAARSDRLVQMKAGRVVEPVSSRGST